MRFLGFIFILALVIAALGFYQGWFSVSTVKAGGKSEVRLGVDGDKIGDDAKAAAVRIGDLSAKAAEAVRSLGKNVGADETVLEGTLSSVDPASRSLTLTADSQAIDLQVANNVTITREGASIDFDQLESTMRARFVFKHDGDLRRLSRVEILP